MTSTKSILLCSLAAGLVACGGSSNTSPGTLDDGGAEASLDDGSTPPGDDTGIDEGGFTIDSAGADAILTADAACAAQKSTATLTKKPVDIVLIVDNSGSMTEEIVGIQKNINASFASILAASGLDYRVILVARHGAATGGQSVCIEAPLSGIPAGGCATPPAKPVNAARFFHYSVEIASTNGWCQLLSTYAKADEFNLAPNGWSKWLRPEAYKSMIIISDDRSSCTFGTTSFADTTPTTAATNIDTELLKLAPTQFGTASARNYNVYSIVGVGPNTPATKAYAPTDPMVTTKCSTAVNPGPGHQALSILTGGLRFPLCDTTSYDTVFKAIAAGVIAGAKVSCDFPVPVAPPGKTIDPATVVVRYTPGAGASTLFKQVPDAASCTAGAFYLDAGTIKLCPAACSEVQADTKGGVEVLWGCDPGSIQ